jgi:hypothetical protein
MANVPKPRNATPRSTETSIRNVVQPTNRGAGSGVGGGPGVITINEPLDIPMLRASWTMQTDYFTDLAGTTVPTADGQKVNLWLDQSANGLDLQRTDLNGPTFKIIEPNPPALNGTRRIFMGFFDILDYFADINKESTFCIVALIQPSNAVNYSRYGGRRDSTTAGWNLIAYDNRYALNLFAPRGVNEITVKGSTPMAVNDVSHVVVNYDGSEDASGVEIYVDGVRETEVVVSNNLVADIDPVAGRFEVTSNGFGRVFEWSIANYNLSADDVANLYATAQTTWGL